MSAAENKKLLQEIFTDLANGDSRKFVDSMADDFTWIVAGATNWSQTFRGKQAVLTELFGLLQTFLSGPVLTTADRFIADEDYVAVEARGQSTARNGRPYNNRYCFVFRVADGKLREVKEYMDTELASSVLSSHAAHSA